MPEIDPFRSAGWLAAILLACAGCAGPLPCASSASCPAGTVCQPGGACAPLAAEARFVRGRWLFAADWGGASSASPSDPLPPTDALPIGGEERAVAYLEFGPIAREPTVARAWLRLRPHPSFAGPAEHAVVVAHRARPFEGARVTRREEPGTVGPAVAERAVLAGGPRPIVLDVTDAVRQAQARGRSRVWLALRVDGGEGPAFLLGSPRATERELRPRLELWVR